MFGDLSGAFVPPLQLWAPTVEVGAAADPVRDADAGVELGLLLLPTLEGRLGIPLGIPLGLPLGLTLGLPLGLSFGLPLELVETSLVAVVFNVVAVVAEAPAPLAPVGLTPPLIEPTPVPDCVVVTGAGEPDPSDGAAEQVFTDKPTVNDARPAASRGSDSPSGTVPT